MTGWAAAGRTRTPLVYGTRIECFGLDSACTQLKLLVPQHLSIERRRLANVCRTAVADVHERRLCMVQAKLFHRISIYTRANQMQHGTRRR